LDVSVIVVSWNTKELLCDCLGSILEQAGDLDYEIIVVDNASSDGSADMVRSRFPEATVIVEQSNRGYSAAANTGIRVAQGRYVLVLNSDTLICDGSIDKTVGYADKHPETAVVGCQVWENSDKVQMTCFRFPSLLNLFLRMSGLARCFKKSHFFGREDMQLWRRDSEQEVDVVSGMFMLVRREAIDEVGLMDEAYFLYCEDTDWCYRFAKAGWKMLFWPGAFILHLGGGGHSSKSQELKLKVQMQKSILLFFKKHHGVIQYLLARLILTVYTGLRYLASTLVLIGRGIVGRDVDKDLKESQSRWCVFKYCIFGIEPEGVNRES
jgi:GT2 family glycosyltransferase